MLNDKQALWSRRRNLRETWLRNETVRPHFTAAAHHYHKQAEHSKNFVGELNIRILLSRDKDFLHKF